MTRVGVNSCYKFVNSRAKWEIALKSCESENAVLVTIDIADENNFVGSLSNNAFWIGLNDISQESHFVWVSSSRSAYHHWFKGEPNNLADEDCVHMSASAVTYWNDLSCTSSIPYVCEKGQRSLRHYYIGFTPCVMKMYLFP